MIRETNDGSVSRSSYGSCLNLPVRREVLWFVNRFTLDTFAESGVKQKCQELSISRDFHFGGVRFCP
jgi:hypothetical protein